MSKNIIFSMLIGLFLSTIAFYFSFKNIPFLELINYIQSINYYWIIPGIIITLFCVILKTLRWQIIIGNDFDIGFWQAFNPLLIGFMINCILPGRVGELARPVILYKKENIPFSTGIATVLTERCFDLISMIFIFIFVFFNININPESELIFAGNSLSKQTLTTISNSILIMGIVLMSGIILISVDKTRNIIIKIIEHLPVIFWDSKSSLNSKIQNKIIKPFINMIENFAKGVFLLKDPLRLFFCIVLSFVVWIVQAFSFYIIAKGCPGINLSFMQHLSVMIIICFFIALPSVPGYWGLWEAGGMFAMNIFAVPAREAAGFTLTNHAVQLFPVIIIGLVSAAITGINIRQIIYEKN